MSGFDWFLVFWFALGAFLTALEVGRPPQRTTATTAGFTFLFACLLIAGLLISRGAL